MRNGNKLWEGSATASSLENQNNNNGLIALLITALVSQIVNDSSDASHKMAAVTSARLLSAGGQNSILYGPRSPFYGQDPSHK